MPSRDPRSGSTTATGLRGPSGAEVAAACERAARVSPALDRLGRPVRVDLLGTLAAPPEERRDDG